MLDLEKLTPVPWEASNEECPCIHNGDWDDVLWEPWACTPTDAEFISLARLAFDVMMRRGWGVERVGSTGWFLTDDSLANLPGFEGGPYSDPFTALVEADKWYKANIIEAANS
jgi:hypothetical protein